MTKLRTFFYSFKKSLLDSRYYKDLEKTSFWFSYKYLFFLMILILVFRSLQMGVGYLETRKSIPHKVQVFEKTVTDFYPRGLEIDIQNGRLMTNAYEPYVVNFPSQMKDTSGKHLLVIDTQGLIEDYPSYNTLALATEKALVYPGKEKNSISPQLFYFSEVTQPFHFERSTYDRFLMKFIPAVNTFAKFIDVYVFVGILFFIFFGAFFWLNGQLVFLFPMTFIVWLIALLCKKRRPYWTIYRFGMHALTWPILLSFVFGLFHQPFGGMYALIYIVWILLIVLGMRREKVV